jgi:hypothetical protein
MIRDREIFDSSPLSGIIKIANRTQTFGAPRDGASIGIHSVRLSNGRVACIIDVNKAFKNPIYGLNMTLLVTKDALKILCCKLSFTQR